MIFKIKKLENEQNIIDILANYLINEWYDYYGENGKGNVYQDLQTYYQLPDKLPFAVVALDIDNNPVGLLALKYSSIDEMSHLSPWIASGFVIPSLRGQGLGGLMLEFLLNMAKDYGFKKVFSGTATSDNLLKKHQFQKIAVANQSGHIVNIYEKIL